MNGFVCQLCSSANVKILRKIKSPYTGEDYSLYRCLSCQSLLFDLNEHPIDLEEFYNSLSFDREFIKNPAFHKSSYWSDQVSLIRKLRGGEISSVLDVGCRTGDFLLHWPDNIKRVGIELSTHSANVAKERGLTIYQSALENARISNKFDAVTCYAILEHLTQPLVFLERLASIVADNGVLVIMIPSFQSFKAQLLHLLRIRWHMYSPPEHLNLYSKQFLDGYLNTMGFSLMLRRYTSGGLFNPFIKVPLANRIFSKLMWYMDAYTPLNTVPVFDHMYCYYVKRG